MPSTVGSTGQPVRQSSPSNSCIGNTHSGVWKRYQMHKFPCYILSSEGARDCAAAETCALK